MAWESNRDVIQCRPNCYYEYVDAESEEEEEEDCLPGAHLLPLRKFEHFGDNLCHYMGQVLPQTQVCLSSRVGAQQTASTQTDGPAPVNPVQLTPEQEKMTDFERIKLVAPVLQPFVYIFPKKGESQPSTSSD